MTAKRFTIRSYNGIGCHIFDGSIVIAEVHRADIKQLCDLLNALYEENQTLKKQIQTEHQMLDNAILLERTRMGQNSLKQYKEAIQ